MSSIGGKMKLSELSPVRDADAGLCNREVTSNSDAATKGREKRNAGRWQTSTPRSHLIPFERISRPSP
jgi:hypothetical protein